MIRQFLSLILVTSTVAIWTLPAAAEDESSTPSVESAFITFDEKTVDTFGRLPVQDGGRIKPISTYARYALMQLCGRSEIHVGIDAEGGFHSFLKPADAKAFEGEKYKYSATEWLLLTFLHPKFSDNIPVFVVDDSEVLTRIGASPKKKRDLYSYADVAPHQQELVRLTGEAMGLDDKERERVPGMIMNLGQSVLAYQRLSAFLQFARDGVFLGTEGVPEFFGARADGTVRVSRFLEAIPELRNNSQITVASSYLQNATTAIQRYLGQTDPAEVERAREFAEKGEWDNVLRRIEARGGLASALQMFPPVGAGNKRWATPSEAVLGGLLFDDLRDWSTKRLGLLENVEAAKDDPAALNEAITALSEVVFKDGEDRKEVSQIDREVRFYKSSYFPRALVWFIIGFVLIGVTWAAPNAKWSRIVSWIALAVVVAGLLYLCVGIAQRCIIRSRPPITGLYDTILFITACSVMMGLFIEWINRQRIGLSFAALLGAAGMFLAIRYEFSEASDTMPTLVAVLDTNFWLWTHVTIINMGYAGGLVAAALAHLYLIGRCLGLGEPRNDFYKSLTRMVYGLTCFCLLFSLVGTVLGGIWANYSWGRFWGWDPKENGALMIVLWSMIILHMRLGGFIKDLGVHVMALLLGNVVVFSWWGVNNLGIGLHSYGFTSGIMRNIYWSWAVEAVFLVMALVVWFRNRTPRSGSSEKGSQTA